MAVKDSVLNFVIKAKNLASDAVSKFRKDVETLDATSADAGKSVDSLGTATDSLGKETSAASSGTKTLNSALDDVSTNANDAAQSLERADDSIDGIASSANASAAAADKAGTAASKLAQRYDAAGKPIETARQELEGTNEELNNVDGASGKAGTSIGSLTKRLLALAAAAVGINTIKNALRDMLNTGDQFERLSLQMNQTMGSLAAGKEATEWVKDFAKNTPLQLQEVTDTFLRLKNFGLDPLDGSMQAIVDQSAKLGKGYEAVEGISLALGQAWAKQKLQGEEIMQLLERGVPVWDLLAKTTGKTTAEIQKMSEAGLLGRDAIKAMIDEMGKQSAGAAAQNMTLLSGYISNLKDEWSQFLALIAQSGALDYAKDQLRQLIDYIQELKATGQLQELAKNISNAFIAISEASKSVVLAIKDNIGTIALLAKAYAAVKLADFASDASRLAVTLGTTLVSGTTTAATATKTLATAMRSLPWVIVIDQAVKATQAYFDLQKAKQNLAKSKETLAKVQADETQRIAEFNQQTGLAITSLNEIIAMQDAGSVAVDEYTGKWRLATDTLTAAEIAQRAHTEAMAAAKTETAAFETQFEGLMEVLTESQKAGKDTADVIAEIGLTALQSGERGVESLSLAIGQLAQGGDEAKAKLKDGLAAFLVSLSEEQYSKFGAGIEAALKRIEGGADITSNRLSFMKTILEADLAAAAQRAGVDLEKVFTGVDEVSKTSVSNLELFGEKLKALGIIGNAADAAIKAGLLETLKGLDTSQEIDATTAALKRMNEAGQLSNSGLQEGQQLIQKRNQEIQVGTEVQKISTEENKKNAGTWTLIGDSSQDAANKIQVVGSATKWLQEEYKALRGEVEALGPAALAAFDKLQGVNVNTSAIRGEFADLKQAIADAGGEIDRLQKVSTATDFTGLTRFLRDAAINAAAVKKEYAEQKLSLERLQAAYADGSISAQKFINATRGAASSTSLLNQSDLSALKNQIRSAQEQMESFRESTLGTLNSLKSELANLQGDADRVAQLAYEARIADLNSALSEARKTGDKESIAAAQEALRLAQEIYAIKKQQIAEEKRATEQAKVEDAARKAEEAAKTAQQQQQAKQEQTPQQNTQQTGSVQRVEIALPSGKTANFNGSPDDVNALLDFLNEAGMRSTQ